MTHDLQHVSRLRLALIGSALSLILCLPALADLRVTGDDVVAPYRAVRLQVDNGPADAAYLWDVVPEDNVDVVVEEGGTFRFVAPPGVYRVKVRSVVSGDKGKIKVDSGRRTITIGVPEPLPPKPPDPGPTPKPPTPGPVPIPGINGLAVLIVYESDDKSDPMLTPAQNNAVFGQAWRAYLKAKCAPDPEVSTWNAYRMYDQNIDTTNAGKDWQEAMKRPRASLPWIVISNAPKGLGFEGPLPANAADLMALVKRIAEPSATMSPVQQMRQRATTKTGMEY